MPHQWTWVVLLGLSPGALAGCYVVSPNAYPVYPPPPPPPSAGPPPSAPPPVTVPPTTGASPPVSGRRCETVLVEAHWETVVRPGGQQERVWVPARNVQECR
jgi:hypothetical protein